MKVIKPRKQMQEELNLVAEWGDYLPSQIQVELNGRFVIYRKVAEITNRDIEEMKEKDNCGHF